MITNDDNDRGLEGLATLPPPPGEDDAYSAATRVGGLPAALAELMRDYDDKHKVDASPGASAPSVESAPGASAHGATAPGAAIEAIAPIAAHEAPLVVELPRTLPPLPPLPRLDRCPTSDLRYEALDLPPDIERSPIEAPPLARPTSAAGSRRVVVALVILLAMLVVASLSILAFSRRF